MKNLKKKYCKMKVNEVYLQRVIDRTNYNNNKVNEKNNLIMAHKNIKPINSFD